MLGEQPRVVLGHGASGSAASMAPWVRALADRGVQARAIDLPRGSAERAIVVFAEALADRAGARCLVPGGHSFGGRVASLLAARLFAAAAEPPAAEPPAGRESPVGGPEPLVAGLLLLSYPLHRPGRPDDWSERTAHWPQLRCPVLLLSGESDPFARPELLRRAVERLPKAELVTYPGVGHGLIATAAFGDAADRAAAFARACAV